MLTTPSQSSSKDTQASCQSQSESTNEQDRPPTTCEEDSGSGDGSPISKVVPVASTSSKTNSEKLVQKAIACPHCGQVFLGGVNLGGHISKAHKGMSATYNKKMQTRELNTQRREQRALAKGLILRRIGRSCDKRCRVFVTQLTNLLLKKEETKEAVVLTELDDKIDILLDRIEEAHRNK